MTEICPHADCPFLMRFTAAWVYVAMATAGVSLHEKSKQYETACNLLRQLLGTAPSCLFLQMCIQACKSCETWLLPQALEMFTASLMALPSRGS